MLFNVIRRRYFTRIGWHRIRLRHCYGTCCIEIANVAYSSSSSRARTYSQIYCNRGIKIQVDMVADRTQIVEQRMTSGYSHLRCSEQVLRAAFLVVQSLDLNYFLARFSSYLIGRSLLLHLREISTSPKHFNATSATSFRPGLWPYDDDDVPFNTSLMLVTPRSSIPQGVMIS